MKFKRGDIVSKPKGYPYPGVVVSAFLNLRGEERFVVESISVDTNGMLHIFNGDQLVMTEKRITEG